MHRAWWIFLTAWTASPLRRLSVAAPTTVPEAAAHPKVAAKASFGPAHLAEVKRKPALLQKAVAAANHRQPVYIPKIGIANVTTPTSFPPPPPVLNPIADYQPLDTALGDLIQKQFVQPPTLTPPPTQEMLNVIYACPLLALDTSFIVRASNGCEQTGRSGIWTDSLKNTLLQWNEKPEAISDLDLTYAMPNGDGFGFTQGEIRLGGISQVDFMDCGLNVKYYMKEYVFHVPGKPASDDLCTKSNGQICAPSGTIYLKYEIWQQGGTMVAVSSMVELFADEFTLSDSATGAQLVKYSRNAAWYPQDGCQTYNKEWIVTVGGGHLSDAPVRWVLGMFITALSLRDEERSVEGLVRTTETQMKTWGMYIVGSLLVVALIAAFVYLFMTWEVGGQTGHERVTLFCLRLEDRIFPVTMYKNKSYT